MSDGKGDRIAVKQQDEDDEQFDDEIMAVHATVVPNAQGDGDEDMPILKGEVQAPAFRDWPFSVLFFVQVAAIAITAMSLGPASFQSLVTDEDEGNNNGYDGTNDDGLNRSLRFLSDSKSNWSVGDSIFFIVGAFLAASVVVMSVFRIMVHHPLLVIKISFFVAPVTFGVVGLLMLIVSAPSSDDDEGDVHGSIAGSFWLMAAVFSLMSICYYYCYQRFMPFAAINLKTALTAVRANMGLFFLSVGALFAIYAWSIMWAIAMGGIMYHDQQKEQVPCSQKYNDDYVSHDGMCDQQPNAIAITMLVLCFYWTQQVIQNTVHTTTAGTVGSWWVRPAEVDYQSSGGCCGQDVSDSLYRSCTYSFGSICFGSLLVAILQTLENMARNNRNRRDILSIVIQCLIMCLRAWLEYFNSWAFCYVGIYGYDYVTAGRKVIELFKARGWTTLITDRLVFRVLIMANLGTAALSGALCVLLMLFLGINKFHSKDDWSIALVIAFWVGFVIGLIISNTVLFVVESAVRTVMICFCEQPMMDPQQARPELQELKETYAATYPDIFRFGRARPDMEMAERNVV